MGGYNYKLYIQYQNLFIFFEQSNHINFILLESESERGGQNGSTLDLLPSLCRARTRQTACFESRSKAVHQAPSDLLTLPSRTVALGVRLLLVIHFEINNSTQTQRRNSDGTSRSGSTSRAKA